MGLGILLAVCGWSGPVSAQQNSLITRPDSLPPSFGGEVHLDLAFPLATRRLCPAEGECVVGIGGGIGGNAEWRFPSGLAVGAGYDLWFLDGNGVYELAVMQVIQLVGRWVFLQEWATHPFVGAGVGLVILGDTFRAATAGASIDLKTGLEIEITPTLAFTGTAMLRLFSVAGFVSQSDGVSRASSFGVNAAVSLSVGLRLTQQR